jgi:hypothetical protein
MHPASSAVARASSIPPTAKPGFPVADRDGNGRPLPEEFHVTDQTARVTTALRSASEQLEMQYPHLSFLFVILKTYVLQDIPGISERMEWDVFARKSDIRREIRALFKEAVWKTSGLLVARAQYSHAINALQAHRCAPGFARTDRKALRVGPLPYRTALATQFAAALPKADAEMCANSARMRALGAEAHDSRLQATAEAESS